MATSIKKTIYKQHEAPCPLYQSFQEENKFTHLFRRQTKFFP